MPAPKGNNFAAKPEAAKFTESLFIRMTQSEKEICFEAASDRTLSGWARDVLLTSAMREQNAAEQPATSLQSKSK